MELKKAPWILLVTWSGLSFVGAWLGFKYIPRVRCIAVNDKTISITFAGGRIHSFAKEELERVGTRKKIPSMLQPWWREGIGTYRLQY